MTARLPLLLALVGCGGDRGTDSAPTAPALDATASVAAEVEAVWWVRWTTAAPGTSHVAFGLDGALDRTAAAAAPGTVHEVPLVGLKADRTYTWQAVTELDDGAVLRSPVEELHTRPVPADLAAPDPAVARDGAAVPGGAVLMSQVQPPMDSGPSWALVVDGDGDPVWWRRGAPGTMVVTARRDGPDVLYAEWDRQGAGQSATLHRVAVDGSAASATVLPAGHHDFHVWPDGTVAYIAHEVDPALQIASDAILELRPGATEPDRVWSWLDDYPVAPWPVCEHTAAPWPGNPQYGEWTHSNSLVVDPSGEHYLLMSKYLDAVVKIRRADGALVWQLGGRDGDFAMTDGGPAWTAIDDTRLFSHAHMSHAYAAPAGSRFDLCLAVFDNAMHTTAHSRAIEVCVDETAMQAEVTWAYDEPDGGYTALMGDVRRLDDGWLVGWSGVGHIDELGPGGDERWRLDLADGVWAGRVSFLSTLAP